VLTRYDGDAAWDRQERTALARPGTAPEDPVIAGYQLFVGKAQCGTCHPPPLYTDGAYHYTVPNVYGDPGRAKVDPALKGAFRTPTVRGAALRPAFFHTGNVKTLDEVVAAYVADPTDPAIDPAIAKINLTADETKQLVAFLRALAADRPPPVQPVLP
jgi:cytochrome c peroxidase